MSILAKNSTGKTQVIEYLVSQLRKMREYSKGYEENGPQDIIKRSGDIYDMVAGLANYDVQKTNRIDEVISYLNVRGIRPWQNLVCVLVNMIYFEAKLGFLYQRADHMYSSNDQLRTHIQDQLSRLFGEYFHIALALAWPVYKGYCTFDSLKVLRAVRWYHGALNDDARSLIEKLAIEGLFQDASAKTDVALDEKTAL
jgi:hypothetical protein